MKTKKPKIVSFFTGAGGLDLGFEAAGGDVVFACDILPEACESLRKNRPELIVYGPPDYSGDIQELDADLIFEKTKLKTGEVDIVIGGPPCQPFSVAAAQRFLKGDKKFKRKGFKCEKGNLVFSYLELVLALRPKVFMIENVPGILSLDGGKNIASLTEVFEENGYYVNAPFVLNARDYGVPQSRERAFIIGSVFKKKLSPPQASHSIDQTFFTQPYSTVAQAFYGFNYNLPNAEIRDHKDGSLLRYKTLSVGQREKLGRVDRLDPDRPSKTVIAGGEHGGGRSHLHPFLARTISVRECARLQTFPDDYVFYGKNSRQFTQVGNAVPPLLAEKLASHIFELYFGAKKAYSGSFELKRNEKIDYSSELLEWSIKNNPELLYNDLAHLSRVRRQKVA